MSARLGIVVIGRNEGRRLERCLDSLASHPAPVVYVDSGSSDGSPDAARSRGASVVELDRSLPFTMARGRNAGFARLVEQAPGLEFVQFVDGDCEVVPDWLERAEQVLADHTDVGVVCGRRRERFRGASIYNRLADMEWDGPPGEALFAGGDVMMRTEAFRAAGGYNEAMIAGEDPEISVRIRRAGWRILRLAADMTLHDAAMTRFGQWWKRAVRSGHAYAEGAELHRHSDERPWAAECRSSWAWAALLPAVVAAGAVPTSGLSLLLLAAYPLSAGRIAVGRRRAFDDAWPDCVLYGAFCMLGKFAHAVGQTRYRWNRITGRRPELIEYKHPEREEAANPRR